MHILHKSDVPPHGGAVPIELCTGYLYPKTVCQHGYPGWHIGYGLIGRAYRAGLKG